MGDKAVSDEAVNFYTLASRLLERVDGDDLAALELLRQQRPSLPLDCAIMAIKVAIINNRQSPHQ